MKIRGTDLSGEWCYNPKRTEKPCALGFSVRFGLKYTLRCVVVVLITNIALSAG